MTSGIGPGKPTMGSPSGVTATTITINFSVVLGSFAISKFEYSFNGGAYTGNISGSATSFQFTGLIPSTSYTFRIRAVDVSGQISEPSDLVTQSTSAEIAPSAPSVSLTQRESAVGSGGTASNATKLNFSYGVATAGTYPVVAYQWTLYQGATLVRDWAAVPMAPNTNYIIEGLTHNTSYTVYVRAIATANGTTYSSNGSATTSTDLEILNSAPSLSITSEGTVNVTFSVSGSSGGTYPVLHYQWLIVRSRDGQWVNSGTTTSTSNTVNAGTEPDGYFTIYAAAVSTSGNQGDLSLVVGRLDPEVPNAPSIYFSSESASERGTAYLAWGAVGNATQYRVLRNGIEYITTTSTSYNVPVVANANYQFTVRAGNRLDQFSGLSNAKSMATGNTGVPWSMTTGALSPVRYFGTTVSCDSYIGSLKINIGSVPTNSGDAGYKYIQTIGYEVASIPGSTLAYTSVSNRRLYFLISGVTQSPPAGWQAVTGAPTQIRREVPGRGLDTNFALDYYENGVNLGGANISNTAISVTPDGVNWADYVTCQENVVDNVNTSIRGRNLYITGYQTTATTYG